MLSHASLPRREELSPPDIYRRTSFTAAWTIQCSIGIIAVALRFWARSMLKTRWKYGWDDWIILFTLLTHLGGTILVILIGINGGTRHLAYIQPASHAVYVFKLHQITQPFRIMASGTGKISVAFLIMRFLHNTGKWRKRFLWALIVITFVQSVTTTIFNFTQCDPVAALWDPSLKPTARCWDPAVNANYGIFGAAWGCAFDLILATMPLSITWKLQLSLRKRIGIIALLGCGVFGAIVTAVKAKELELIKNRSDFTWETYTLYICVSLELSVIVLSGPIPTYKPLWDRFVKPRLHSRASDGSRGSDLGKPGTMHHQMSPNVSVYQGLGNYSKRLRFTPAGTLNIEGGDYAVFAHSPLHHLDHGSSEVVSEKSPEIVILSKVNLDSSSGIQVTETFRMEWMQHANESYVEGQLV